MVDKYHVIMNISILCRMQRYSAETLPLFECCKILTLAEMGRGHEYNWARNTTDLVDNILIWTSLSVPDSLGLSPSGPCETKLAVCGGKPSPHETKLAAYGWHTVRARNETTCARVACRPRMKRNWRHGGGKPSPYETKLDFFLDMLWDCPLLTTNCGI